MKVRELFQSVRQNYLTHFETVIAETRRPDSRLMIEKAMRSTELEGQLAVTPIFGLPFRGDLFLLKEGEEPEERMVDAGRMVNFEPFALEWQNGLLVETYPFSWNRLELRVPDLSAQELDRAEAPLRRALVHWFDVWFEADREREGVFLGVSHYLSDPETWTMESENTLGTQFQIDLGSAPVSSLFALFDALGAVGLTRVEIGLAA